MKDLESLYNTVSKGNDLNKEFLDAIIKTLQKVSKQAEFVKK